MQTDVRTGVGRGIARRRRLRHRGTLSRGETGQGVICRGERRRIGAVVDLGRIAGDDCGDHCRNDVGREPRRLAHRIVGRLGAREREARGSDLEAGSDVHRGERAGRARARDCHTIGSQHPVEAGRRAVQGRRRSAVVGLVVGGHAGDRERRRGDIGVQTGQWLQGVIGRTAPADREGTGGHLQVRAHVGLRERSAGAGRERHRSHIAGNHSGKTGVRDVERRGIGRVVDLVRRAHPDDGQRGRRNCPLAGGRGGEHVIGEQRARIGRVGRGGHGPRDRLRTDVLARIVRG